MIIRCPECSTGFKLPADRVTADPMKVRCSKCEHLFRVGRADDETPRVYDADGNKLPDQTGLISAEEGETLAGAGEPPGQDTSPDTPSDGPDGQDSGGTGNAHEEGELPASEAVDADESGENQTQIGVQAPAEDRMPRADASASASEDYNPFPHADQSDVAPKKSRAIVDENDEDDSTASSEQAGDSSPAPGDGTREQSGDATGDSDEDLELFDDEDPADVDPQDDPFDGAFDESEREPRAEPGAETDDADSRLQDPLAVEESAEATSDGSPDAQSATTDGPAGRDPLAPSDDGSEEDLDSLEIDDEIPQDDDSFWAQQREDEEPDQGFEGDREYFDPESGGRVRESDDRQPGPAQAQQPPQGHPASKGSAPGGSEQHAADPQPAQTGGPGQSTGATSADQSGPPGQDQQEPSRQPSDAPQSDAAAQSQSSARRKAPADRAGQWTSDDLDRLEGSYSTGGFQKFANFLLIVLLVAAGFLTYVAFQNDWHLDFLKFRQMLEVTFQNGEYEPREDWQKAATPAPEPPENPLRFEDVVAQIVELDGADGDQNARVLVIRGSVRDVDSRDYLGVEVRGLLYDENDKRLTETQAPVGRRVSLKAIRQAASPEAAGALVAPKAKRLKANRTQPFTLIFTDLPSAVTEGRVHYGVEIARKVAAGRGGDQ